MQGWEGALTSRAARGSRGGGAELGREEAGGDGGERRCGNHSVRGGEEREDATPRVKEMEEEGKDPT